ncbi:hypothetical protein [Natronobacterium gregoryi]|uniref:Uncharacterized protein n=2 Tax=Natronobacterium gregoryi TaxID=44930 RepID=L0AKI7_NATGS|nr:hypothetical protein [Natronobacterium gregoryi]AFZ74413.1 hypothetical protein Natgr_3288 [Natronobacterium gregoryi SP2]ELY72127.1 hypothetical protein C490_04207 [Natronobacterium gregoryi SP2]PLK19743.1 hypothetical protein CYV19_13125 [Natronobacterium gregoryi SP2]SFJ40478.1 hypothetical protein SAMN05443661_12714 [Natronobacterium gregoryi]
MGSSPTANPPRQTGKQAPLGVKIICVLGVLASILTLFVSLQIMTSGGQFAGLGLLFLALTGAYLVVIYGLWTVQPWGWTWGMIVFVFGAVMDLFQGEVLSLLISLVIIAYLYSKRDYYRD